MSVVAAKVYKDKIEIAADSIQVRGYTQEKVKDRQYAKLFQENGITIGGVGQSEENVLFRIFCKTHMPKGSAAEDITDFLVEYLDWYRKRDADKKELDNCFIIIFQGIAYTVNHLFVAEIKEYQAIGAGMDYALSALYLGHTVDEAVKAACELTVYCEEPINKFVIERK